MDIQELSAFVNADITENGTKAHPFDDKSEDYLRGIAAGSYATIMTVEEIFTATNEDPRETLASIVAVLGVTYEAATERLRKFE